MPGIPRGQVLDASYCQERSEVGHLPVLEYFVDHSLVRIRPENEHIFLFAARYGHLPIVEYLLQKGVNIQSHSIALWWAAKMSELEVVRCLVSKGLDISKPRVYDFRQLVQAGHVEVVDYLFSHGYPCDPKECPRFMTLAARNGELPMLRYLEKKFNCLATPECIERDPLDVTECIGISVNTFLFLYRGINKAYPIWKKLEIADAWYLPQLKTRLWLVCNLFYGTVSVGVEEIRVELEENKEWGTNPYYDSNLGMLICSYVD